MAIGRSFHHHLRSGVDGVAGVLRRRRRRRLHLTRYSQKGTEAVQNNTSNRNDANVCTNVAAAID